ncbi:MAG TPA: 6-phosphofructokinase [Fimbriimonadaceae bacterium]|nr:6-phosphofructokinase [Fimbriimonadaceae bacterium]
MAERVKSTFDAGITSERQILRQHLRENTDIDTHVRQIPLPPMPNPVPERILGTFRDPGARKSITADMEIIQGYASEGRVLPSFLEAGPRESLVFQPQSVRAAIVTTGGLAPGLNCVVHSLVTRHCSTYSVNDNMRGGIFGVYDGFMGLCRRPLEMKVLRPEITEPWLEMGGSALGCRRFYDKTPEQLAADIVTNLRLNDINILYIIGGDGSMKVAHEIATIGDDVSVVGIPKTMDNDLLWVWQSFGFNTAVEQATAAVNTMHWEAESTRRVCLLELFGAESGFVAANAALASGHVDLVLIPEPFTELTPKQCETALADYVDYLARCVRDKDRPHALVVLAEGVAQVLSEYGVKLGKESVSKTDFVGQLKRHLQGRLTDRTGNDIDVYVNQPRHNIRAVRANAHDQIYTERLGALAADNALAGYTDFMISQWLTEYVLVPLPLVIGRHKSIPPSGIFWKQVMASTGQPFGT